MTDLATVLKVAAIFGAASDPPDRLQPIHVDSLPAVLSATNDDVVEDHGNDGAPLVEIHARPFAPKVGAVIDQTAK